MNFLNTFWMRGALRGGIRIWISEKPQDYVDLILERISTDSQIKTVEFLVDVPGRIESIEIKTDEPKRYLPQEYAPNTSVEICNNDNPKHTYIVSTKIRFDRKLLIARGEYDLAANRMPSSEKDMRRWPIIGQAPASRRRY